MPPGPVRESLPGHRVPKGVTMGEWTWSYEGYDPAEERLREALCTLGNGYFATRGAAPETAADAAPLPRHVRRRLLRPARLDRRRADRSENEDMVNLPNWLPLRFRLGDGGAWFTPDGRVPAGAPAGPRPAARGS